MMSSSPKPACFPRQPQPPQSAMKKSTACASATIGAAAVATTTTSTSTRKSHHRRSSSRNRSQSVTTTGFSSQEVCELRQAIEARGWLYEANLTVSTSVLIVNPTLAFSSSSGASTSGSTSGAVNVGTARSFPRLALGSRSAKLEQALKRPHLISVVTPLWATLGNCCSSSVQAFSIHEQLLGTRVSTTSLDEAQRNMIEDICKRSGAQYATSLCRKCSWLVVSDYGTSTQNEKMMFAARHADTIQKISFSEFVSKFWREFQPQGGGGGNRTPLLVVAQQPPPQQQSNKIVSVDRQQQQQCHSHQQEKQLHPLGPDMSRIFCYCTPASLVTPEVRHALHVAQVQRVPVVTPATTLIIVLGDSYESIFPRQGLSFVSLQWVQDCCEQMTLLPEDVYRVTMPYCPIVTCGSMNESVASEHVTWCVAPPPPKNQKHVNDSYGVAVVPLLQCRIQDALLLGPVDDIQKSMGPSYFPTSHLVIPKEQQHMSDKALAWARRAVQSKRHECYLVDFAWIEDSATAAQQHQQRRGECGDGGGGAAATFWLDVEPYLTQPSDVLRRHHEHQTLLKNATTQQQHPQVVVDNVVMVKASASRSEQQQPKRSTTSSSHDHYVVQQQSTSRITAEVVDVDGVRSDEEDEDEDELPSPHRPSFDADQLNVSLEALVGRLEQRSVLVPPPREKKRTPPPGLQHAPPPQRPPPPNSSSGSDRQTFLPPPPLLVGGGNPTTTTSSSLLKGSSSPFEHNSATATVIGPSFTGGGFSPLGSRAESMAGGFLAFVAAANGGGGTSPTTATSSAPLPLQQHAPAIPESQFIVYQHDDHVDDEEEQRVPNAKNHITTSGSAAVLGMATAPNTNAVLGLAPTATTIAPAVVPRRPPTTSLKLLVVKTLRDDEALMTKLQRIHGVQFVNTPEEATHYVVPRLSKTETFLCCLARGLWILQPSYLMQCAASGRIEAEEDYEWYANPKDDVASASATTAASGGGGGATSLLLACRAQRLRGGGMFRSWGKVYLTCNDTARARSFMRVLKCGGSSDIEITTRDDLLQRRATLNSSNNTTINSIPHAPETFVLTDDNIWDDDAFFFH
ncbi:Hypothetical protein, putative [Bodo saltans]|uniref:BRCT domain-containing protein n=1 Tax=Bodo saltans TaxID=75058 RepID=A0A0S4KQZ9_BODSA|nr:Hypothetical protein, putative [Bodo saltans]|eukprot:CUI15376.1 Hypothetical protein, putative [Bodo saltans]